MQGVWVSAAGRKEKIYGSHLRNRLSIKEILCLCEGKGKDND